MEICSALIVVSISVSCRIISGHSINVLRDDFSILRRCPNVARVTASRAENFAGNILDVRGFSVIKLEITFGAGTNAEAGTLNSF